MSPWHRLPRTPMLPVVAGILIVLPTCFVGLVMDDVLVRMRLLDAQTAWGDAPWWDLYTFARPELNADLRDAGFHPWWSDLSVKMHFFRPLSALTHHLDYRLWPDTPALHHLHSVGWYGLVVAAVGALYRRLAPQAPAITALAALIFALAAPHAMTVAWVAARNTLITLLLSVVMIGLHVHGSRASRAGAVGLLAAGLLAGEAMLGGVAYVIAWQLFGATGSWRSRLLALVPHGVVVVGWRLWYSAAGFGSQQTGIYHDPGTDLPGFLAALGVNLPVLTMTRMLQVPLDAWAVMPAAAHTGLLVAALVILPLIGALLWPLRADPMARFWAAGMVISLVPFTATMPMDRLVIFGGLGSSMLLAMLTGATLTSRAARLGRTVLLVVNLPLAAAMALFRVATIPAGTTMFTTDLAQSPTDAAVAGQTFVYVSSTFHRTHNTLLMRQTSGEVIPRRVAVLTSMLTGTTVTRLDEDSLLIAPDGGFMRYDLDRIHRRDPTGLPVGTTVALPDLDVEIRALTPDGRPAEAAFHFRVPLEDDSLRWLVVEPEDPDGFPPIAQTRPFVLPAVGESVRIASVSMAADE